MTLKICAILLLLVFAIAIGHEIFSSYTTWYFRVPNVRLTVDGKEVQGWLHRGNHGQNMFLTRRDKVKAESYLISLPRDNQRMVWSCGDWTAPRFPVFPIGDVNPPCWTFSIGESSAPTPTPPPRNIAVGTSFVEFTADDGKRIKASW